VDDKSDIFFIDSHTKSIGGYDDFIGIVHEIILHLFSRCRCHSSSCCCERNDRKLFYVLKVFYKSLYLHITGSKIMSPLTDTVSFIYGYE